MRQLGMSEPFHYPEFLFEILPQLAQEIARVIRAQNAVLDGEICCLQSTGRSDFYRPLFHASTRISTRSTCSP